MNKFIHGHNNRGISPSDETRKKQSEKMSGRKPSEETRRKMSVWQLGKKLSDEHKQQIRLANKKRIYEKFSEEIKQRMSKAHLGQISWNKGKSLSEGTKQKISQAQIKRIYSESYELSEETREKLSKAGMGRKFSSEVKKKISEKRKEFLSIPENKQKLIKRILGSKASPNKLEIKLLVLLKFINPSWKFVGNGKLIIGGKCPDFWDGKNKLIELFGNYWHKNDSEKKRIDYFKKYNYECIVVWEKDFLHDLEKVVKRIKVYA